jgi:hypothetical protein
VKYRDRTTRLRETRDCIGNRQGLAGDEDFGLCELMESLTPGRVLCLWDGLKV